jgi:hypothetical protein
MENIQTVQAIQPDGSTIDFIVIDRGNNEFTSMPKSIYDTLVSNSSTPQAGN